MTPHVHLSAVHGIAVVALIVAVFGTTHLLALTNDNRFGRAIMALGF
jgi:ABC-type xylose transport system permease subunit